MTKLKDLHAKWMSNIAYSAAFNALVDDDALLSGFQIEGQREVSTRKLQDALKAGEISGDTVPFESVSFLRRMRAKYLK